MQFKRHTFAATLAGSAALITGAVFALPVSGTLAITLAVAAAILLGSGCRHFHKKRQTDALLDQVIDLMADYADALPAAIDAADRKRFRYKLEIAKRLLNRINGLDPENALALHYTAMYYRLLGNLIDAAQLSVKADRICPGNARVLTGRGLVCRQTGDCRQAMAYFEKAVRADPANPVPREHLAGLKAKRPGSGPAAADHRKSSQG